MSRKPSTPARPSSAALASAIDALDTTAARTRTLEALRAWRLSMAKVIIRPPSSATHKAGK